MLFTYRTSRSIVAVLFSLALSACSLQHNNIHESIPTAEKVCITSEGVSEPGFSFMKRKTAQYLAEEGFQLVDSECDITIFYTAFNHGQWEVLDRTLFGSKSSSSWRTEGVIALRQGSQTVIEDEKVDLRDYETMQDLLDALAKSLVDIVEDHYQSPSRATQ